MTFNIKFGLARLIILWSFLGGVFSDCLRKEFVTLHNIFFVAEDLPIGEVMKMFEATYDSQWKVDEQTGGFFHVFVENTTDNKLAFYLNVTSSTDVDNRIPCDGKQEGTVTISCDSFKKKVTIAIDPFNDHTPTLVNNQGLNTKVKEDMPLNSHIIEFGTRVKDQDCPSQAITFTVTADRSAHTNNCDGTKYFGILGNGTLYLKKPLNYEDIVCSIGGTGELFLTVVMTDVDLEKLPVPRTGKYPLTITVLNVDDEPPKFINSGCSKQCSTCEQTSYSAYVSYDQVGNISTYPTMIAEDVEKGDSVILYYIRQIMPTRYIDLFTIDHRTGTIKLLRSFQTGTNKDTVSDFDVQIIVQAMSNRTQLKTKNVTVNLTVNVPPPTTTVKKTTTKKIEKTTKEITTTEEPITAHDGNGLDLVVIIVPIAAALLLIIIIILIYLKRSAITAEKQKYVVEPKIKEVQKNGVEKVTY